MVSEEGLLSGKIVIKSKNSQFKISIPYRAFVLKGQLEVAPNVTHFHLKSNVNNNGGDSEVGGGAGAASIGKTNALKKYYQLAQNTSCIILLLFVEAKIS